MHVAPLDLSPSELTTLTFLHEYSPGPESHVTQYIPRECSSTAQSTYIYTAHLSTTHYPLYTKYIFSN